MNKVFQHAGDLVNPKVAHNLMRLIAEGFGEDDDTADSQLRSSAVWNYNIMLHLYSCLISVDLCVYFSHKFKLCNTFFWLRFLFGYII